MVSDNSSPPTPGSVLEEYLGGRSREQVAAEINWQHAKFAASLPKGLELPELKVTAKDIGQMEYDKKPIPGDMLPILKKTLLLDDDQYRRLLISRFPALDAEELNKRPADQRDITLFQSVLELSGLFRDERNVPIPIGYNRPIEGMPAKATVYAILPRINYVVGPIRKLNEMMDPDQRWYTRELETRFYAACNNLARTIRGAMTEGTGRG